MKAINTRTKNTNMAFLNSSPIKTFEDRFIRNLINGKTIVDHSTTIFMIIFTIILFSALQLTAQEVTKGKKVNETTKKIKTPNSTQATGDKTSIKDESGNVLMEVTDEGTAGSIKLNDAGAVTPGTNKLYNNGGSLYWNGSAIGGSVPDNDWDVNGNELLLFNPTSQFVGIGTNITETLTKLHVRGDEGVLFQGTFGNGNALSLGAGTRFHFYPKKSAIRGGYVNGIQWDDAKVGNYSTAFGKSSTASGNSAASIGFETVASGNSSVAMGYRNSSVGNRSAAFGSNSTSNAYSSFSLGRFNIGSGTANSWVPTDPVFEIGIGSDVANKKNALTVLKNGKVGIGTDTPDFNLSIHGGAGTNSSQLMFQNGDTGNSGFRVGINSNEQADLVVAQNKAMRFFTNNTLRIQITGDGNVGIGAPSPTAKLDVNGSAKIGTNGTVITEIREISGTTNIIDPTTTMNYPSGFTTDNTHVLSGAIKVTGGSWVTLGTFQNNTVNDNSVQVSLNPTHISLTNSGQSDQFGAPYKIVIMRID